MGQFTGLDGCTGTHEATNVGSVTAMMSALRAGKFPIAAGETGALNAYKDDDGMYRAELNQRLRTIARCQTKSLAEVRRFMVEHWAAMGRDDVEVRP